MTDLDRRQFLAALGGAAGLLGLGAATTFAAPAGAATLDAITLGNRINSLGVAAHGSSWDWAEWCQAAQYWAEAAARGSESGIVTYGTARAAYAASSIVSTDMGSAPAGSFSYYDRSSAGHVVTNVGNGYCINTSPLMAGKGVHEFGRNLRITALSDYPAPYLGWSRGNGANPQLAVSAWSPGGGSGGDAWAFNPPSATVQKRVQSALAARGRYDGPVDGAWGVNSVKGIQATVANVGYTGPVDGVPGAATCHYVQVYAQRFGDYTGPVDSVLGANSWAGFALGLERP